MGSWKGWAQATEGWLVKERRSLSEVQTFVAGGSSMRRSEEAGVSEEAVRRRGGGGGSKELEMSQGWRGRGARVKCGGVGGR